MERVISILIGYGLGLFQTAFIYGKMNGIDVREHGSGNAGTTNALRVLGRKAGVIVLLGDICKTILAVVVVRIIFSDESYKDILPLLSLYAGTGAVLGHNFPFYLKFKGGKGIAATGGLILAFDWRITIICAVLFFSALFITHYVSLGSLLVYAAFMISVVVLGQMGEWGMTQPLLYEMYALAAFLTIMAYIKHRANIVRLVRGTENKTYLSNKNREEKQ